MEIVLKDAFIDAIKMVPLLLVIYILISFIENRYSAKLIENVKKAGKAGPALGAVFGVIPQCGFSVISTALYTKRVLTLGTLLAVYLSTSDEAIPVILSQPDKTHVLLPLLAAKVTIAIVAGYGIDLFLGKKNKLTANEVCASGEDLINNQINVSEIEHGDSEHADIEEKGCCGHNCAANSFSWRDILVHPMIHTLKVFVFLFATSLLINFVIFKVGINNLHSVLLGNSIFQPVIAAFIGLIPNCAASVAITEIFLKGGISFGSAVAGLCASAGLGLLMLFKENEKLTDTLKITVLLLGISISAGVIIQIFVG